MSVQKNVRIVKEAFAAFGRGDIQALLALFAEDIEWITPGEGLPLAGTYRGHAAVATFFGSFARRWNSRPWRPANS
jgi:hypothetical protein